MDLLLLKKAAESPFNIFTDKNTVAELLDQGADVNAVDEKGCTALMIAARNGHTKYVSALLAHEKINVNAVNKNGKTALMIAALNDGRDRGGNAKVFSALLAYDRTAVDINYVSMALITAAKNGHTKYVSALLAHEKINVNAVNKNGKTALIAAAANNKTDAFLALLAHKEINVDKNIWDLAVKEDNAEIAAALLSRGDVDLQKMALRFSSKQVIFRKELAFLLAVVTPEEELRNAIITDFNQRNPKDQIQQQNNDMLGAGFEVYNFKFWYVKYLTYSGYGKNEAKDLANRQFFDLVKNPKQDNDTLFFTLEKYNKVWANFEEYNKLKDFESWYVKYLTDSGYKKNEAKDLANRKLFDLTKNPKSPQEVLEKEQLITDLTSKLETLDTLIITRIAKGIEFKDQATSEDQEEYQKELEVKRVLDELTPFFKQSIPLKPMSGIIHNF